MRSILSLCVLTVSALPVSLVPFTTTRSVDQVKSGHTPPRSLQQAQADTCWWANYEFVPSTMQKYFQSPRECQQYCDSQKNTIPSPVSYELPIWCSAWNYWPNGTCSLATKYSNPVERHTLVLTAYSNCQAHPSSFKFVAHSYAQVGGANVAATGSDCTKIATGDGTSLQACQKSCDNHYWCNAVNFGAGNKDCILRWCAGKPTVQTYNGYVVFTSFTRTTRQVGGSNVAAVGSDCKNVGAGDGSSEQACKMSCDDNAQCNTVNFNAGNRDCILRACAGWPTVQTYAGYVVFTSVRTYTQVGGSNVAATGSDCPNVGQGDGSSLQSCQASCSSNGQCTAINYNAGAKDCILRSCAAWPTVQSGFSGYAVYTWLVNQL